MTVRDENNIPDVIDALPDAAADAVGAVARDAFEAQQSNWESGRDAMGLPWAPLSPETIRQKGGSRILIDTGEMRDSMDVAVDRDSMAARIGPTGERAAELAEYHEFGTTRLPARPVLEPTGRYAEQHYRDAFDDHLGGAIDRNLL